MIQGIPLCENSTQEETVEQQHRENNYERVHGGFGCGTRNERTEKIINFAKEG